MKYSNDTIRNRAHDLPACSAVHHVLGIKKLDKLLKAVKDSPAFRVLRILPLNLSLDPTDVSKDTVCWCCCTHNASLSRALKRFHLDFIIYKNLQNIHFTSLHSLRFASLRCTSLHFTLLFEFVKFLPNVIR